VSSTFRSLRYRNARLFFAGLAISNVGTWLQLTAMSLLVYRITGEATAVGISVAFQFLPMLFLGAWAGAVADARNKRRMAILTQSGLAAQAFVLAGLDLSGVINLPIIYVMSLVLGVVSAFDNPARRGLVTELVSEEDIPNATSLNTAVMTGSRIFGPALAAVLVSTIGTGWCFLFNGLTFFAIIFSLTAIRTAEMYTMPRRSRGGQPVREALRFVASRRDILVVYVTLLIVSTFAFNTTVVLPKLADERWGDETAFGIVLAVMSIGSLTGSLLTARFHRVTMRWFMANIILLAVAGFGIRVGVVALDMDCVHLVDSVWCGRRGIHYLGQRDHTARKPARHAQSADGSAGGGIPWLNSRWWPDHGLRRRCLECRVGTGIRQCDQSCLCSGRRRVLANQRPPIRPNLSRGTPDWFHDSAENLPGQHV